MSRPMNHTATHASRLLKATLVAAVALLLLAEAWLGYRVHKLSDERLRLKSTYSFVNNVSFGLLSVDIWRDQVIDAASEKISSFRLTPEQEDDLRKQINASLHGMVDDAFADVNKKQKSLGGKLKKLAVKTIVDPKEVHAEVPGFTNKLMAELTKPSSYRRIANIADTLVAELGRKIYDSSAMGTKYLMDSIYRRYGAGERTAFERNILQKMEVVRENNWKYTYAMLGCAIAVLICLFIGRKKTNLQSVLTVLAVVAALVLLLTGVTTTLIEIDAMLQKLELHLVSKAVTFANQDLFFQSQSIIDVCWPLITSGRADSFIVGAMVLLFSVVFPLVKLVCIALSRSRKEWARSKTIYYFAFQSDKWDMSNVMVVAILMTFIGFNGIVDSTLSTLNFTDGSLSSATLNNTSIQPGYILFVGFVVFSYFLSAMFKKICEGDLKPNARTGEVDPDCISA